jgi:hypothetical protein
MTEVVNDGMIVCSIRGGRGDFGSPVSSLLCSGLPDEAMSSWGAWLHQGNDAGANRGVSMRSSRVQWRRYEDGRGHENGGTGAYVTAEPAG